MPRQEAPQPITRDSRDRKRVGTFIPKEGLAGYGGNFDLLDQNGHFRIPEPPFTSQQRREWRTSLTIGEQIEFNTLRSNVLELFGVDSLPQIRDVMADPQRKAERTIEANRIIAKRFGIRGSDEFIRAQISEYYKTAVRERKEEARKLGIVSTFELSNAVALTSNVLELANLAFFSPKKRIRFEAGKILDGMDAVAAADSVRREEETTRFLASPNTSSSHVDEEGKEVDPDVSEINAILDGHFYSSAPPEEPALFKSRHAKDDFRTLEIIRIPPKQARIARFKDPGGMQLWTDIPERVIIHDGVETLAYATVRKKSPESTTRKARRKGTRNIRKAVEDTIAMRVIVQNKADIPVVHEKLVQAFADAGHSFTLLELQDSLSGGTYAIRNPGSSENLEVVNIMAKVGPWIAEIQYTDYFGWIDSTTRRGVARADFELNRLYESGVPQHDFPEWIYKLPHDKIREKREREIRAGIANG
ncbi:MAG: hypothetical protein UT87_C0010G0001, partial [Candidatus Levybacteria bacterium GW2011_GWC1_40_19]